MPGRSEEELLLIIPIFLPNEGGAGNRGMRGLLKLLF